MKSLLTVALLVVPGLVSISFAEDRDLTAKLDRIAEKAEVSNGSAGVTTYRERGFDVGRRAQRLAAEMREGHMDCKFAISVGRRRSIDRIADRQLINDPATAGELENLRKAGKLVAIVAAEWDGSSGDSEYCSIYLFEVYAKGGRMLYLEYNYTD